MIDKDLASSYDIEAKFLNPAVMRNSKIFPTDFVFQLTKEEFDRIKDQVELMETSHPSLRLRITM